VTKEHPLELVARLRAAYLNRHGLTTKKAIAILESIN